MANKRILIIEDEQPLVDLLVAKLEKEGYEVGSAVDREDGYNKVSKFNPDLILLDIVMPKMDGYEVLEKLNKDKNKIPIIIISNSGQMVEIEKTKKLGAIGHLIKTEFNPIDVINKVKEVFGNGENGNGKKKLKIEPKEDPKAEKNGIKVLLVEDDSFLREICGKKLTREGYLVYEAMDGEQALNIIEETKLDIILLDIILPAIDGFQILNHIRSSKDKNISKVPVIMLSNLGQDDDVKKAMEMGANDYLIKAHFTTDEIAKKIKTILKK